MATILVMSKGEGFFGGRAGGQIARADDLDFGRSLNVAHQVAVRGWVDVSRRWGVQIFQGAAPCVDHAAKDAAGAFRGGEAGEAGGGGGA